MVTADSEQRSRYTPEQYLAFERQAEDRHEFMDGAIYVLGDGDRTPLTGPLSDLLPAPVSPEDAAIAHDLLARNVLRQIEMCPADGLCMVFAGGASIGSSDGAVVHPDVAVACGEIQFEDESSDTLLNPLMVIEVLSPTTEAYDRGAKFAHYRRVLSLKQYVLIAQDRVSVEVFSREGDSWVLTDATELTDTVRLTAIGYDLALADVYAKVQFPEVATAPTPTPSPSGSPD